MNEDKYIRISPGEMHAEFKRVLVKQGFTEARAQICADLFTENSLEGVYSHGVNRFPRFSKNIRQGLVRPGAEPELIHRSGSVEQYNGNRGPGPLNALFATEKALSLAGEYGTGLVTLAETNHWMRSGHYGWYAARRGFVLICWTNTCPNMPAWGGKDPRLGNNPLVIALPFKGNGLVFDFSMSLYSYGKLEYYNNENKELPYPGGYNIRGELTKIPGEILESYRILPAGYWKGSGFSLFLDILAATFSGGLSTHQIKSCASESGVSQVFIAIDPKRFYNVDSFDSTVEHILDDLHRSVPVDKDNPVRYPGENIPAIREKNSREGIPVNRGIWEKIISL